MQTSQGVWICSTTQNQISEISHAEKISIEDKMQVLTCSFSAVLYCSLLFSFALNKGIFVFSLRQGYPLQAHRAHYSSLIQESLKCKGEGKASFSEYTNKQKL